MNANAPHRKVLAPFPAAGQPERFSPAPGRRRGPGGTAGPFPPLGFRMVLLPSRPAAVAVPATAVATDTVAAGSSSRIVSWAVAVARSVAAGVAARTTAARVTGAVHAAAGLDPMAAPTAGAALAAPVATRGAWVGLNSSLPCDKGSPAGFRLPRIAAADWSRPGPASAGQG